MYTRGEFVESELEARLDVYNGLVYDLWGREDEKTAVTDETDVENAVKLASWLMFSLLHTHPFLDGNGRVARLAATRVLSPFLCPVPVPIAPDDDSEHARQQCIDALVTCRQGLRLGEFRPQPQALARIVLHSLWSTWQRVKAVVHSEMK